MPKLTINNREIEVPEGMTVLQAAELLGIEIPIFCYHRKLSIAGNCRMCLVEQKGNPKPIASCAMPVSDGMVIETSSPMAKKAQKGNLEFLLINHPLDCPICDQGGECDLQDITMAYGSDTSRFSLNKRAVPDKEFGPLIETSMNRCIQCTRCVRFATEIAGVPELGALGRGEHMEIGTYVQKAITSELSGNLIDICPVGALTSKPYNYKARSWELVSTPSIDVMDAVGSNIRVDIRGREVMRVLPRSNDEINEDWISDKARFACDGLKSQRLDQPYARNENGQLVAVSWDEAFKIISDKIQHIPGKQIAAIVGDLADAESIIALKDLMTAVGTSHFDSQQGGQPFNGYPRCSYLFNTTLEGIERADFCLLIGTNTRWEAPLVNARIRKAYVNSSLKVARVGPTIDLGYPVQDLGNSPQILEEISKGKHRVCSQLKSAKYPMLIVGIDVVKRKDGPAILNLCREIASKYNFVHQPKEGSADHWNGFNILHKAASSVATLDLGFYPDPKSYNVDKILSEAKKQKIKAIYLLGADEVDMSKLESAFVIYQGHHGDQGAAHADVILPGAAYTEKSGTFVNTEGRVQRGLQAVLPPGEAKEDWKIIRALSEHLGLTLPYNTLEEVRKRIVRENPLFECVDICQRSSWTDFIDQSKITEKPFSYAMTNYYMTDSISRHSVTMAKCTQEIAPHGVLND